MEIQNTLENKAKFFGLYWGQRIMLFTENQNYNYQKIGATYMTKYHVANCHLELTKIDNITDEHARMLGFEDAAEFFANGNLHAMFDDLRLLGYAVGWSDLSVNEMIEYGWMQLK